MPDRYARHPDLRLTRLDEDGVVLHLGERRYHTVNPTGLRILEHLEQPGTLDDLVAMLTHEFEVEPSEARRTAEVFVASCVEAGLLVPATGVSGEGR
jgi:hypothetical protein